MRSAVTQSRGVRGRGTRRAVAGSCGGRALSCRPPEDSARERTLDESIVSLRRKELAETFGCMPSQINYVLRSRFTPERGFLVESQRGGHGYIRILRIACEVPEDRLSHIDAIVGDAISKQKSRKLLLALQERVADRKSVV